MLELSAREEFVRLLKVTDSVAFRRYRPTDPLPRNRFQPPTANALRALEAKYCKQIIDGGAFLLEDNLEFFLAQNLNLIEEGLRLYESASGDAIGFLTSVGEIDLLCCDLNGNLVIIELKKNETSDQVVGQLARYIGWAEENYPTRAVRGIIVIGLNQLNEKLRYAAKALRAQVYEYEVSRIDDEIPILKLTAKC